MRRTLLALAATALLAIPSLARADSPPLPEPLATLDTDCQDGSIGGAYSFHDLNLGLEEAYNWTGSDGTSYGNIACRNLIEDAVISASGPAMTIVRDCFTDGTLEGTYTRADLDQALAFIPAPMAEYSSCVSVIVQAGASPQSERPGQLSGASAKPTRLALRRGMRIAHQPVRLAALTRAHHGYYAQVRWGPRRRSTFAEIVVSRSGRTHLAGILRPR